MPHPLIEAAEQSLRALGYGTGLVPGDARLPADQLVVEVPASGATPPLKLLFTLFQGIEEQLREAYLLQCFFQFPERLAVPPGDLARVLIAVNNVIALGQFCCREKDGMVYFRAVALVPDVPSVWPKIVTEHVIFAGYQLSEFASTIHDVAIGAKTADETLASDPRLRALV